MRPKANSEERTLLDDDSYKDHRRNNGFTLFLITEHGLSIPAYVFLVKFKKSCLENFTKTLSKHVFLEEEGRNTTPLKTPAWTAEVVFTAKVWPKYYKVSQSRWKEKSGV